MLPLLTDITGIVFTVTALVAVFEDKQPAVPAPPYCIGSAAPVKRYRYRLEQYKYLFGRYNRK